MTAQQRTRMVSLPLTAVLVVTAMTWIADPASSTPIDPRESGPVAVAQQADQTRAVARPRSADVSPELTGALAARSRSTRVSRCGERPGL